MKSEECELLKIFQRLFQFPFMFNILQHQVLEKTEESLKVSDAYILFDILCMYNNNKTALFEISSEFCKYKECVPKRL